MKDLYRRNNLQPLESNFVKIHNCKSGNPDDNEAAFAILLNKERKQEYDKVYSTLKTIGFLRHRFNLNAENGWHHNYPDFIYQEKTEPVRHADVKASSPNDNSFLHGWRYYALIGSVAIALGIGLFAKSPEEGVSEDFENAGAQTVLKHTLAGRTLVRDAPSETASVIYELGPYEDIRVLVSESDKGWSAIDLGDNKKAYVFSDKLANGDGYSAYLQHCQSSTLASPGHGEALLNTHAGQHSMVIVNPPGYDAVVKLKDELDQDVLIYYVEGGKTLTLNNIPEGHYSIWYAVGDNYDYGCGHFTENVRAWTEREKVNFHSRMEGQLEYGTSYVLNLKNPLSDARPIDLQKF